MLSPFLTFDSSLLCGHRVEFLFVRRFHCRKNARHTDCYEQSIRVLRKWHLQNRNEEGCDDTVNCF